MKISARARGGFSGQIEHYQVDTAQLRNGEALVALLHNLDFLAPPPPPVGADIRHWEITVDDGQSTRTVAFAEDGTPASAPLQELITHLRNTA